MAYGTAVREARAVYGRTQDDVARSVHISDSILSDIERGKRPAQPDVMRALITELDDPRLLIETQLAATGGIGAPYMDAADRHLMALKARVRIEFQDVFEILDRAERVMANIQGPKGPTDEQLTKARKVVRELIEAETIAVNTVAEYCRVCGFSVRQMYAEHHRDLAESGDLKKEKRHP